MNRVGATKPWHILQKSWPWKEAPTTRKDTKLVPSEGNRGKKSVERLASEVGVEYHKGINEEIHKLLKD